MKHRWVKAPSWWVCSRFVAGMYCSVKAVVGCKTPHPPNTTCDEGRCRKHAPRSTKTSTRGKAS